MSLFNREPRITKLAKHIAALESGLHILEKGDRVPSPAEIEAMAYIRARLPFIITSCVRVEPKLWQRVESWRNTPYTPFQSGWRKAVNFIGYWLVSTFALYNGLLWAAQSFFTQGWYVIAVSAFVSFVAIIYLAISELR